MSRAHLGARGGVDLIFPLDGVGLGMTVGSFAFIYRMELHKPTCFHLLRGGSYQEPSCILERQGRGPCGVQRCRRRWMVSQL